MVGIAILNYNNIADTCACLDSIYKYCPAGSFGVCVVDNASKPEVCEAVRKHLYSLDSKAEYIVSGENLGYARGNNLAFWYFDSIPEVSEILVLNNDVILTQDIITPLSDFLKANTDCAVVSPLLYSRSGKIDYACARRVKTTKELIIRSSSLAKSSWGRKILDRSLMLKDRPEIADSKLPVQICLPSGSCMLLSKAAFSSVGYFDSGTFLYFEEDILWAKLSAAGYKSFLLPFITAIHLGAETTSKISSAFVYKAFRQSMLHYMKNFSGACGLAVLYVRIRTGLAAWWKEFKEDRR